ncbi:MAG: hypothetical protein ACKO0Z_20935 [Betaproteobacteria bacterium]
MEQTAIQFIARVYKCDEQAARELFAALTKEAWAVFACTMLAGKLADEGMENNLPNLVAAIEGAQRGLEKAGLKDAAALLCTNEKEELTVVLPLHTTASHHEIYERIMSVLGNDPDYDYIACHEEVRGVYDCLSSETKLDESDPNYEFIWLKIVSVEPVPASHSVYNRDSIRVVLKEQD